MQDIQTIPLSEETQRRYLNYALSVITSRALPDVRDGLKPVQRRILYTMLHDLHLVPDAKLPQVRQGRRRRHGQLPPARRQRRSTTRWCAWRRTSRCATRWSTARATSARSTATRPPPMRYTECKLQQIAVELIDEIRTKTVDWRPNYDGTRVRAGRAAGARPEPAGQRRAGHRRRHGDVHPAAQPRRGRRGVHRARSTTRRSSRRTCSSTSRGRTSRPAGRCSRRKRELKEIYETGSGLAQAARRVGGRGAQGAQADADHRHHVDPVRADQAVDRREDRRDHPRAQAAAAGRRARRVDHRRAHRARDQEGRRSRAGHGVPLQAHARCRPTCRST